MIKHILSIFDELRGVFRVLDTRMRWRAMGLFGLLTIQSFFEVFFLVAMTYLGMALTASDALRETIFFSLVFLCSPSVSEWAQSPLNLLMLTGIVLVVISIVKNLVSWQATRKTALLSEDIAITIGHEIMQRYLYRDYAWHLSGESSSTLQVMMWRANVASMLTALLSMYACMFTVLALFISLVGQEPILTTLVIGIVGVMGYLLYKIMRNNIDKNAQLAAKSSSQETRALLCATKGVRDVLIYRQQEVFLAAITDSVRAGRLPRTFNNMAATIPTWVLEVAGFFMVVSAIAYLVYVEHAGIPRITTALALLMLTAWRVLPYCNRIVSYQVTIRALRPMATAVIGLLVSLRNTPSDPAPQPSCDFTFDDCLEFNNVSFAYKGADRNSLTSLNFKIRKGEKIGIIGASGAGKSTLVGVVCGLLPPTEGEIHIDGLPLTPERGVAFASMIGYVPQAPFLFSGTLAENVAFSEWGKPFDEQRVVDACQKAAIDFYQDHPKGILFPIGENGAGLSGGQAQRVSIARALYSNPHFLIFDEATSALDQVNEKNIQATIESLTGDVTCLIIAHRLTTVATCDRLIWIDNGQIIMDDARDTVLARYVGDA